MILRSIESAPKCGSVFAEGKVHALSRLKEITMETLICYCFGYTISDIERDVLANSKSTIMEKIIFEKKAGGCQCATKNPKGR